MPKFWIFTAVTMEARALRRAELEATVIGIGAGRLGTVIVPPGTTTIVMAGVGGAVDPSLAVGDVVTDGPPIAGVRCGAIHTVDRVVSTPAEKAAVFAATGAAVVDMEQAVVRRWAEGRGLAVIGVRAVSDAATDAIDPAVVRFVTDTGRPRPGVIVGTLLRRPRLVPQLMRLNANTRLALARLSAMMPAFIASGGPGNR
jgi:adenosylhomocysteine nucleosidase